MAFFDERNTGDLLSRLVGDTEIIQMGFSMNIAMFFNTLVMVLGSLALLIYISWKLCIVLIITVIPILGFGLIVSMKMKGISESMQNEKAKFSSVAEETFSNMKTVKAFATDRVEA